MVPTALGTDTLGSVRIPASLCGVYGYKPSYGYIDTDGVFPLSPSLDTLGVIAKDLSWIEKTVSVLAPKLVKRVEVRRKPRLAIPKWFRAPPEIRRGYEELVEEVEKKFLDYLSATGYDYEEVEMPVAERLAWRETMVIRYSEGTHIHLRYRDKWDLYFPDVRRLVEKGLQQGYTSLEYLRALASREDVRLELKRILKKFDALVTPTTLVPAPRIDEVLGREDGPIRGVLTYETIYASYAGVPAISIPALKVRNLPVGVQIIMAYGEDPRLLALAKEMPL
jgi:aspartyl-tRNA(Asn)/glutamyl-tRNA(Gln) amidotransferase subunit A